MILGFEKTEEYYTAHQDQALFWRWNDQDVDGRDAIRQTAYTATSATLEWDDDNADVSEWILEYSKNCHFDLAVEPVTELTVSGTPSVTITGLEPETAYYARVKSVSGNLQSNWGGCWTITQNNGVDIPTNGSTRFVTTASKSWVGFDKEAFYTNLFEDHETSKGVSGGTLYQEIYTPDEIGLAGAINSISLRVEPTGTYKLKDNFEYFEHFNGEQLKRHFEVYLLTTDKLTLTTKMGPTPVGESDWIEYTDADRVFSGWMNLTPDAWNTIEFDRPFNYDGQHNLVFVLKLEISEDDVWGKRDTYYPSNHPFAYYFTTIPQVHCLIKTYSSDFTYYDEEKDITYLKFPEPFYYFSERHPKHQIRFGIFRLDLADQTDNSSTISAHDGETRSIFLNDRTLYRDGDWNTLCLPFNMDATQIAASPLAGATVKTLDPATSSLSDDGTLTLNFTDAPTIEAGKPYIVKWAPGTSHDESKRTCIINTPDDWDAFAAVFNNESGHIQYYYNSRTIEKVVLGADITLTDSNTPVSIFSGTFDGNGHTLTYNAGPGKNVALFNEIKNATFRNLHVAGEIIFTDDGRTVYLIKNANGSNTFTNCRFSQRITGPGRKQTRDYNIPGGVIFTVGDGDADAQVSFADCLFDGEMHYAPASANDGPSPNGSRGFVAKNNGHAAFTRCLLDPAAVTQLTFMGANFCPSGDNVSITDCYYKQPLGPPQGIDASGMSAAELVAALGSAWTVNEDHVQPRLARNALDETDIVFGPVQIVGGAPTGITTADGICTFLGTYDPVVIGVSGDRRKLYLGAENKLYYPNAAMTIGAFRAYFQLNGASATDPSASVRAFRMTFDDETTGIKSIDDLTIYNLRFDTGAWYTLDGRRLVGKPTQRGVYVNNGRKVAIK